MLRFVLVAFARQTWKPCRKMGSEILVALRSYLKADSTYYLLYYYQPAIAMGSLSRAILITTGW